MPCCAVCLFDKTVIIEIAAVGPNGFVCNLSSRRNRL